MKLSENLRSWANALRKCKTDEIVDKLRDGAVFDGFANKTADFVSRAEHVTIIKELASEIREEISSEVAQLKDDLRQALPYVKHMANRALAIQIEAHLEGREQWEPRDEAIGGE